MPIFYRKRCSILDISILYFAAWFVLTSIMYRQQSFRSDVLTPEKNWNGALSFSISMKTTMKDEVKLSREFAKDTIRNSVGFSLVFVITEDVTIQQYGEMGVAVAMPSNLPVDLKHMVDDGWRKNGFNQYASDLVSVHRKLPDFRDPWCKQPGRLLEDLPMTSIIICFYNEAWSTLLRTVHSVLDRSPLHLVTEVILFDDFSDLPHTKQQLDDYMASYTKVKVVRASKRLGLIRARLTATRHATAPILTYLDSHCECTEGWLEPLLDRIARNSTTVVCPSIDFINGSTLWYDRSSSEYIGGFTWGLNFVFIPVSKRENRRHNHTAEPLWSPTMAGGLFSIDRAFFEQIGTYDTGFDIWGGENLELSFKIWMCGGTLEVVPCSRVGHIFRGSRPYRFGEDVLRRNLQRLADVWLDEYAQYYYEFIGHKTVAYGDVSSRKELRRKLECNSFKWYMENIIPEMFVPKDTLATGELRNLWSEKCLDRFGQNVGPLKVYPCHKEGGEQYWMMSNVGEIRTYEDCMEHRTNGIFIYSCHGLKGNQFWFYDPVKLLIQDGYNKLCLSLSEDKETLFLENCTDHNPRQVWKFENADLSKFLK